MGIYRIIRKLPFFVLKIYKVAVIKNISMHYRMVMLLMSILLVAGSILVTHEIRTTKPMKIATNSHS